MTDFVLYYKCIECNENLDFDGFILTKTKIEGVKSGKKVLMEKRNVLIVNITLTKLINLILKNVNTKKNGLTWVEGGLCEAYLKWD